MNEFDGRNQRLPGSLTEDELDRNEVNSEARSPEYYASFDEAWEAGDRVGWSDYWLDQGRTVQGGTRRVVMGQSSRRFVRTSRELKASDKHLETMKYSRDVLRAQADVAAITPFVQAITAMCITPKRLYVVTPLPFNMYLSDLKRLVVHFSHSLVKYYASCIVYGLEFLRHRQVLHGNLSLSSIALDQYGRPMITDFDPLFSANMGADTSAVDLGHRVEALRYAAMIAVLNCDNPRHFSLSHMHTASESLRKDVFSGVCYKCRLAPQCTESKDCDCAAFAHLIKYILGITRSSNNEIREALVGHWNEIELQYTWTIRQNSGERLSMLLDSGVGPAGQKQCMSASGEGGEDGVASSRFRMTSSATSDLSDSAREKFMDQQKAEGWPLARSLGQLPRDRRAQADSEPESSVRKQAAAAAPVPSARKSAILSGALPWESSKAASAPDLSMRLSTTTTTGTGTEPASADSATQVAQQLRHSVTLAPMPRRVSGVENLAIEPEPTPGPAAAVAGTTSSSYIIQQGVGFPSSGAESIPLELPPAIAGHNEDNRETRNSRSDFDSDMSESDAMQCMQSTVGNCWDSEHMAQLTVKRPKGPFEFDGFQQIMRQAYFSNINWSTLESAPCPENLWYARGLMMQKYCRERSAGKQEAGENAREKSVRQSGTHFCGRSRILYNLFG